LREKKQELGEVQESVCPDPQLRLIHSTLK